MRAQRLFHQDDVRATQVELKAWSSTFDTLKSTYDFDMHPTTLCRGLASRLRLHGLSTPQAPIAQERATLKRTHTRTRTRLCTQTHTSCTRKHSHKRILVCTACPVGFHQGIVNQTECIGAQFFVARMGTSHVKSCPVALNIRTRHAHMQTPTCTHTHALTRAHMLQKTWTHKFDFTTRITLESHSPHYKPHLCLRDILVVS